MLCRYIQFCSRSLGTQQHHDWVSTRAVFTPACCMQCSHQFSCHAADCHSMHVMCAGAACQGGWHLAGTGLCLHALLCHQLSTRLGCHSCLLCRCTGHLLAVAVTATPALRTCQTLTAAARQVMRLQRRSVRRMSWRQYTGGPRHMGCGRSGVMQASGQAPEIGMLHHIAAGHGWPVYD